MFDFSSWIANLDASIVNISLTMLYILFGFITGRLAGKFFGKIVRKLDIGYITEKLGIAYTPEFLVEKGVSYLIYLIAIVFALQQLGMPSFIKYILLILLIILAVIMVALSLKEFIPNLVIGFYLRAIQHLKRGDRIKLAGVKGTVRKIGLFETEIVTQKKNIMLFPNSYFAKRIKLKLKR